MKLTKYVPLVKSILESVAKQIIESDNPERSQKLFNRQNELKSLLNIY